MRPCSFSKDDFPLLLFVVTNPGIHGVAIFLS